jgi:hypothetical protein
MIHDITLRYVALRWCVVAVRMRPCCHTARRVGVRLCGYANMRYAVNKK